MKQRPVKARQESTSENDVLAQLCATLPPLPSVLRYHDEFTDAIHSIRSPDKQEVFELLVQGGLRNLDFSKFNPECSVIFKHVFAFLITQNLTIGTAYNYIYYAHQLTPDDVAAIVEARPSGIGAVWMNLRGRELAPQAYKAAKSLLHLLCAYRLHGWSQEYRQFLSTTLPLPAVDKYASVRSGDVFLSSDEEALIVRHLDDMVERLKHAEPIPYDAVVDAGMLLCAYQFAMRPVQIGMLDLRHVRVWDDEISAEPTVHLTFHMAKQRGNKPRILLTRRVKREWVSIFTHLKTHLDVIKADGGTKFFQVKSSQEVGRRLSTIVRNLIGTDDLGTATDLRHTAAQRLVDVTLPQ